MPHERTRSYKFVKKTSNTKLDENYLRNELLALSYLLLNTFPEKEVLDEVELFLARASFEF